MIQGTSNDAHHKFQLPNIVTATSKCNQSHISEILVCSSVSNVSLELSSFLDLIMEYGKSKNAVTIMGTIADGIMIVNAL